mgnify:CR=1 FL=1
MINLSVWIAALLSIFGANKRSFDAMVVIWLSCRKEKDSRSNRLHHDTVTPFYGSRKFSQIYFCWFRFSRQTHSRQRRSITPSHTFPSCRNSIDECSMLSRSSMSFFTAWTDLGSIFQSISLIARFKRSFSGPIAEKIAIDSMVAELKRNHISLCSYFEVFM